MSSPVTIRRVVASTWKHFTRNVWLGLTTVFVLTLSLLSVNVLVGVNVLLGRASHLLEEKIDISVYFKQDTPTAVLEQAKFLMASLPQVSSAEILTAEQANEEFKKLHSAEPKILAALGEVGKNPFGATLILKAKKPGDYPFLLEALKNPQFEFAIESKNYEDHADLIANVERIGTSVRTFGVALIGVFALFSLLIVFNTIRIAIYTQREEIGIMRLVGASSAYVRMPFILEGVLLALLALLVTAGIVASATSAIDPRIRPLFDGADPGLFAFFTTNAVNLILVEGLALTGLVAVSSWAAVGKYLKR